MIKSGWCDKKIMCGHCKFKCCTVSSFYVEISEKERENFPNGQGDFYKKRIDTDNPTIYDNFLDGMVFVNQVMKKETEGK